MTMLRHEFTNIMQYLIPKVNYRGKLWSFDEIFILFHKNYFLINYWILPNLE